VQKHSRLDITPEESLGSALTQQEGRCIWDVHCPVQDLALLNGAAAVVAAAVGGCFVLLVHYVQLQNEFCWLAHAASDSQAKNWGANVSAGEGSLCACVHV
jgi:hypothetical protein